MVVRDYEETSGALKLDIYSELTLIVGHTCRDFGRFHGTTLHRYSDSSFQFRISIFLGVDIVCKSASVTRGLSSVFLLM